MRLRYLLIGLAVWLIPTLVWAELYRYTDESGVIHFTDNYIEIPENQRPKVEIITRSAETAVPQIQAAPDRSESEAAPMSIEPAEGDPPGAVTGLQGSPAAQEGAASLQQFEDLIRTKAELDKIYDALATEKEALEKEQQSLQTVEGIRAFQDKVNRFNQRLADYEQRRQAFQIRADAYNRMIVK